MGDWSIHNKETGGYYNCNLYDDKKDENLVKQSQGKAALNKYLHFENLWSENYRDVKRVQLSYEKLI